MKRIRTSRVLAVAPVAVSLALVLSACGGGSGAADNTAQQDPAAVADAVAAAPADAAGAIAGAPAQTGAAPIAAGAADTAPVAGAAGAAPVVAGAKGSKSAKAGAGSSGAAAPTSADLKGLTSIDSAAQKLENEKIAAAKGGATDIGVTKDSITMAASPCTASRWATCWSPRWSTA